ncbi:MAG: hypothetical protein R3E90_10770 [Marinicella sp.]
MKVLAIIGLILAISGIFLPLFGIYLVAVSLLISAILTFKGEMIFSICILLIGVVNVAFFSPAIETLIRETTVWKIYTAVFFSLPILAFVANKVAKKDSA